jgi:mannose-6-phosphate isomerase-like protein (cupin superfamily)
MEEQIRLIAERLKGLREVLNISIPEAAKVCGIEEEKYLEYESGKVDIPVSLLHNMARRYKVDITVLLTGNDPHMNSYSLTRKNQGIEVERRSTYKYQSLAYSFINRKAEPFIVTVGPKPYTETFSMNSHPGQEFNYIIEGRMKFNLNGKIMELNEGDSIYFDSGLPHGMIALDDKECKFLAIIF